MERRSEPIDVSLRRLAEAAAGAGPELADLVLQFLAGMGGLTRPEPARAGGGGGEGPAIGIDMRPLPDKLPPRRSAAVV